MKSSIIILAAAVLAASGAGAEPAHHADLHPANAKEASIPFVHQRGIRDFEADGTQAIWLQDWNRRWYHAQLMGPCLDLPFAEAIGAEARGTDRLDRFGTLIVRGQRCPIASLVESGAPPRKDKAKAAKRRG